MSAKSVKENLIQTQSLRFTPDFVSVWGVKDPLNAMIVDQPLRKAIISNVTKNQLTDVTNYLQEHLKVPLKAF